MPCNIAFIWSPGNLPVRRELPMKKPEWDLIKYNWLDVDVTLKLIKSKYH